jgi:hypothetical protein
MPRQKETVYRKASWAAQQVLRASGVIEDVCRHGIGHPNAEWLSQVLREQGRTVWSTKSMHGCCGCCRHEDFILIKGGRET